jgi:leucyl-tRNA synthetase
MVVDCTWPVVDESALLSETVKLVIQVNGKLRGHLEVGVNESKAHIIAQALNEPNILRFIAQATVLKTIVVPGRLVNIVIKP